MTNIQILPTNNQISKWIIKYWSHITFDIRIFILILQIFPPRWSHPDDKSVVIENERMQTISTGLSDTRPYSHGYDIVLFRSVPFRSVPFRSYSKSGTERGCVHTGAKKIKRSVSKQVQKLGGTEKWTRNRNDTISYRSVLVWTGPVQVHIPDLVGFQGWHQAGFYDHV